MREINLSDVTIDGSLFERLSKKWMLVTAGTIEKCNTMTASWGGVGVLWHKSVVTIYVRPERYTYEFIEKEDYFTVSFFDDEYRDALKKCGTTSGRDVDKVRECGFTMQTAETGGVYFEQAKLVLVCRKRYAQDMDPSLLIGLNPSDYYGSHGNAHRMYIGEIVQVLAK